MEPGYIGLSLSIVSKQQPFLVTTALEEFWDTSKPILFLGEWCRSYNRKPFWQSFDGKLLECPWSDVQKVRDASDYVKDVYERLLPVLTQAMNGLHGVNHGERYWRILLGPWLLLYIPIVYDRYVCLRAALEKYPELTTTVLTEESFVIPCDTLEFVQFIKEDAYNLQIYSRLMALIGKEYPRKSIKVIATSFFSTGQSLSWTKRLRKSVFKAGAAVSRALKEGHPIVLRDSYFSPAVELQLAVKTFGKVWPIFGQSEPVTCENIDRLARSQVGDSLSGRNDFEELLVRMLPLDIPQCFVERFAAVGKGMASFYPASPKAIFSAVAWYYDETFKQWAASSAESGATLLGMQHGGNYGSLAIHPSEEHEKAITDRYFSWGWRDTEMSGKVVPGLSAKLSGRRPIGASNQKDGILFVATSAPRYILQFPYVPALFNAYLSWQIRFVKEISSYYLTKMRVRLHREDLGWDIAGRWRDFCPDVPIEDWDIPLQLSMEECRLFVGDQLQTTFLETLSADKPTILFWNPEHNELRPEAQPFYDLLRLVGILHDTPEAAADAVNAVYDDVESWWNEPARQAARINFCDQFARTSTNAVNEWADEFSRIAKNDVTKHIAGSV